jgi:hypothetical protein
MRAWRIERLRRFFNWWAMRDISCTCLNATCHARRIVRIGPFWTKRGAKRAIAKVYV